MNCPDCDKEIHGAVCSCGWVKPGTAKTIYRNTENVLPPHGVGREALGCDLYNAIMAIGEIEQVRILLGRVAMGELKPADYKQREAKLIDQLKTGLLAMQADDVSALLSRYPWVAAL